MSGVVNAGSIRAVLSGSAVQRAFAFALLGRLAYGLLPLCFLFTTRNATGSFTVAATASAVLAFATLTMPLQARLADRYGQRRILPVYGGVYVAVLVTTALMAQGSHPATAWVIAGLLLGLSGPALGPSMRAQWREITPEGSLRRVAYSVDSVGEESLYLVGPVTASVVLATGHPEYGLVIAAGLISIGVSALVMSPYVPAFGLGSEGPEGATPGPAGNLVGVLHRNSFQHLILGMFLVGSASAASFIGLAALADDLGRPTVIGYVEAGMAVGAIVGGLCWTRLRSDPPWRAAMAALLVISASAHLGSAAVVPHLVLIGVCFVVMGAVVAPVFVVAFTAADSLVVRSQRTEASAWVSTSFNAGNAAGTALAGALATSRSSPFTAAACLVVVAIAAVLTTRVQAPESPENGSG